MSHIAQMHFLLFADGEAKPEVFRPNVESMWWGRRDALARCAAAALWTYRGPSVPSPTLSIYLAGDGSVLRHVGALTTSVPVPTERRLVAAWRAASGGGGAVPLGLACVRQRENEAGISTGKSSDSNSNIGTISSITSSIRVNSKAFGGTSAASSDLASFGKRQLLTHLQATLPLEALRRHHLNSSPTAILKKTSVPKLLAIHTAWLTECGQARNANVTAECAPEVHAVDALSEHSMPMSATSTSSYGLAGGALANVLRGLPPAETVLLLLHEDFPNELYNPSAAMNAAASAADGTPMVPSSLKLESTGVKHVVCVLGAVRDMSSEEDADVLRCAKAHGVQIARANLGRTAEFTSKIILGINNLNAHGQLAPTAAAFAAENSNRQHTKDLGNAESSSPRQLSLHEDKLAPLRGWTWNGHRTTTITTIDSLGGIATNASRGNKAADSFDKSSLSTNRSDLECTSTPARFRLHAVVALPFDSNALQRAVSATSPGTSYDTSMRDAMHAAVQAAVWVLWRSKVAGEAAKGDDASGADRNNTSDRTITETSNEGKSSSNSKTSSRSTEDVACNDDEDDDQGLVPVLTLAFRDGPMLTVKRRGLVRQLADAHHAAPSEFQVLQALAEAPLDCRTHAPPLQRVLETYSSETSPTIKAVPKCILLNVALNTTDSSELMSLATVAAKGNKKVAVAESRARTQHEQQQSARRANDVVVALGFSQTEVHGAAAAFSNFTSSTSVRIAPLGVAVASAGAAFAALQQWHLRGLLVPAMHTLFPKALDSGASENCSSSSKGSGHYKNESGEDKRKRHKEKKKKSKRERPDDSLTIEVRESLRDDGEIAEKKAAKKRRRHEKYLKQEMHTPKR